jgi:hypothetical protein
MNELAGTRPESISRLQWFALVTIAGAIFLNTAPYIGLLTNTPNFRQTLNYRQGAADTRGSRGGARRGADHEAGERNGARVDSTA